MSRQLAPVPEARRPRRPEHAPIDDVIVFLRARLAEVPALDWHDVAGCPGIPGPSGACCEARAMGARLAATIGQRITRYERAAAEARRGPAGTAAWWDGAMTALWVEVRADAALWSRHRDYDAAWKDPAVSGAGRDGRAAGDV